MTADRGPDLLEIIGKSLAVTGTNAFIGAHHGAEILIALCPPWAELIAHDVRSVEDVQAILWEHAALPVDWWPAGHRAVLEEKERVEAGGLVRLVKHPGDYLVMVCGGQGSLHALACHSFGPTRAVTRPF